MEELIELRNFRNEMVKVVPNMSKTLDILYKTFGSKANEQCSDPTTNNAGQIEFARLLLEIYKNCWPEWNDDL